MPSVGLKFETHVMLNCVFSVDVAQTSVGLSEKFEKNWFENNRPVDHYNINLLGNWMVACRICEESLIGALTVKSWFPIDKPTSEIVWGIVPI